MYPLLLIPSHQIAEWLLDFINLVLARLGLRCDALLQEIAYIILVVIIAISAGWLVRKALVWILRKVLSLRSSRLTREILQQRLIMRCSHMIPPLIFLTLIPVAFDADQRTLDLIERIVVIYALIATGMACNAILKFMWHRYDENENIENHPLRGILNVAQGIVWIVVTIISVSVLIDKSPAYLFTGLGAFAAALMLIFKDSILGFVAGIQLSQNDMLRVGDWIVVPSTIANGTVIDVTLTVVKVRNWDNTIVMLPPYTLVSTSFQNWRGMWDAGCRRIMRQFIVDNTSIRLLAPDEAEILSASIPMLKEFVANYKGPVYSPEVFAVSGTTETNLGLFRAYICLYLSRHPMISRDKQMMVRLMDPAATGTPVQIYCFTATTKWVVYEAIQSEIFEHFTSMAQHFGLVIFNDPNGADLVIHRGADRG